MSHGRGAGAMMELVRSPHRVKRACLHSLSDCLLAFAALKSQNMIYFDEEITEEETRRAIRTNQINNSNQNGMQMTESARNTIKC